MFKVDYPVPTLELMPVFYKNIRKEERGKSYISVTLRYDDTYYNPSKPTKNDAFQSISPFGKSIYLKPLQNMTSYVVVDQGIFFAIQNIGLFFWHENGQICGISRNPDIYSIWFDKGILKAYIFQGLQQDKWNEHRDVFMGLSEEWYDGYQILHTEESFSYEKILKYANEKQNSLCAKYVEHSEDAWRLSTAVYVACRGMEMGETELPVCAVPDGINQFRVVPLIFSQELIGYRFKTNVGAFDIRIEAAEKYGLNKIISDRKIELIQIHNLLLSTTEIKLFLKDGPAKDISNCEEDCKKLIGLLKQNDCDVEREELSCCPDNESLMESVYTGK